MKTGTVVLIGIGAYTAWYLANLGTATNTITVVFKDVKVNGPTDFTVVLTIQNVSNISVTVNSMTGELYLNDNPLAALSNFTQTIVPANGQVDVSVRVQPSLLDLPSAIQNIITNQSPVLNFSVVGDVNVTGLVLPFNLDKTVTLV